MKIRIVRLENDRVIELSENQTRFLRVNPFSMTVERLDVMMGMCLGCHGSGCGKCNGTGLSEYFPADTQAEIWNETDYRITIDGELT